MLRAVLHTRHAVYALITSALLIGFWYTLYKTHLPQSVSISCNSSISPILITQLTQVITPQIVATAAPSELMQLIQQIMPSIITFSIRYDRPFHATISIKGDTPFVRINEEYILTQKSILVPSSHYTTASLQQIPHVMVNEELSEKNCRALTTFLCTLPSEIIENYSIIWHDKTEIELQPLAGLPYSCIAWHTTDFSTDLLNALDRMAELVKQRALKNKRTLWQIDLRQPHYLMVTPLAKGIV